MATMTLSSSFVTGAPLLHGASECNYQRGSTQKRVITCESSTETQRQITELKSSVDEGGVRKILENSSAKRNWWTPMFNFSSEGMWSSISAETEKQLGGRVAAAGVTSIQGESISLPDLIASSKQMPPAAAGTSVTLLQQRESTPLPDLIASSQQNRRSGTKQVIFDEKKARELRKQTRVHQTWHDAWVHSAIASRLAVPED